MTLTDSDRQVISQSADVMHLASERIDQLLHEVETQRRYIKALEREIDQADALIDDLRGELG